MSSKKILIGVAIGNKYERQASVMAESFLEHNEEWNVKIYNEDEINKIVPSQFKNDTPHNLSEVGRWCAVRKSFEDGYETSLYCDNDLFFYRNYDCHENSLIMFPHYITDRARRLASQRLIFDGVPNLGIFEVNRRDGIEICNVVIDAISKNPSAFYNKSMKNSIWTQTVASYLPHVGYDVVYDCDPSHNVAWWSLEYGDRKIEKDMNDSRFHVRCEGKRYDFRSFHFSSVSQLDRYGDEVRELKEDYLKRLRD